MKSLLFRQEPFPAPEQFGVDLGEFFQSFPKLVVSRNALLGGLLLGRGFKKKLQDAALSQAGSQVVERTVFLALSANAVGFATRGEPFDIGSAEEIRAHGQTAQESRLALPQRQGGGAAEFVYLSQLLGEDNGIPSVSKKKENAAQFKPNANLLNPLKAKAESTEVRKVCGIAGKLPPGALTKACFAPQSKARREQAFAT